MTDYLVATDSVHVTASAADFLTDRAGDGDTVYLLNVDDGSTDRRDGDDALNVGEVRLGTRTSVVTETREGTPVREILAAADARAVDVIVIGPWKGEPGAAGSLGTTAQGVIEEANRPVVVVPLDVLA